MSDQADGARQSTEVAERKLERTHRTDIALKSVSGMRASSVSRTACTVLLRVRFVIASSSLWADQRLMVSTKKKGFGVLSWRQHVPNALALSVFCNSLDLRVTFGILERAEAAVDDDVDRVRDVALLIAARCQLRCTGLAQKDERTWR